MKLMFGRFLTNDAEYEKRDAGGHINLVWYSLPEILAQASLQASTSPLQSKSYLFFNTIDFPTSSCIRIAVFPKENT